MLIQKLEHPHTVMAVFFFFFFAAVQNIKIGQKTTVYIDKNNLKYIQSILIFLSSRIIYFKVKISQNNKQYLSFYTSYIKKTQKIEDIKIWRPYAITPIVRWALESPDTVNLLMLSLKRLVVRKK